MYNPNTYILVTYGHTKYATRLLIQINKGTDLTPNFYSRHNFRFALSHAENGVDMPAIAKIEC